MGRETGREVGPCEQPQLSDRTWEKALEARGPEKERRYTHRPRRLREERAKTQFSFTLDHGGRGPGESGLFKKKSKLLVWLLVSGSPGSSHHALLPKV